MNAEYKEFKSKTPFVHSFKRYFELNREIHDRLKLILQHGILSQRKATELGIPFRGHTSNIFGIPDYDNNVFVYSTLERGSLPIPGNVALFLDDSLEANSPSGVTLSIGELYVLERIPQGLIREIRLLKDGNVEEVERMVEEFIPKPRNVKITTL